MQLKRKIVVTGVECSGKTTLCEALAQHYHCSFVEEYARTYLQNIGTNYTEADLLQIAFTQQAIQNRHYAEHTLSIFDTDASVLQIWSEVKYGHCDERINDMLLTNLPDLYILPHYQVAFVEDPLRETFSEAERQALFERYLTQLQTLAVPFLIVSGSTDERLQKCIAVVDQICV